MTAIKVLVCSAANWHPTTAAFDTALAKLHCDDSVRHAIESARGDAARDGLPTPDADLRARLLARHLLAGELRRQAYTLSGRALRKCDICLPLSVHGRPITATYGDGSYSVAHVHDWACCGCLCAPPAQLGVDVTAIHLSDGVPFSAFLSRSELAMQAQAPREQWPLLFAVYWSLKEAVLKALGLGMSTRLQPSQVSLDGVDLNTACVALNASAGSVQTTQLRRLSVSLQGNAAEPWACSCVRLTADPPYVLAVVASAAALECRCVQWISTPPAAALEEAVCAVGDAQRVLLPA